MRSDIHNGHTGHFPDPPFQIFIARPHNINSVLLDSFHNTIISVGAFMVAFESFEPGVLGDFECDSVLDSELLQLGYDAVCDVWDALAQQAVHGGLEDVELVLDRKVDEVGVEQDSVGWTERSVVGEEHAGGLFGSTNKIKHTFP